MKVIVFAATKGGTGKTSLSYNVALMAAIKHQVFMTDLDPQETLTKIAARRHDAINPRLITDVQSVSNSVRLLESAGYGRDFLFVDTPNSLNPQVADALETADLVVLPTQPSLADLEAQEAVAARIQRLEIANRTLFVLNRTNNPSDTKKALEFLKPLTTNQILTVGDRADYRRALETGSAAWDVSKNRDIKTEIKKLWDLMQTVMETNLKPGATDAKRVH